MAISTQRPASLARRFAFAAAGLAAAALLLTSLASWWLIKEQHEQAMRELASRERQYRADAVGADLKALSARMSEIADSTILATGLVDSAGRETYLTPFLGGIRQINGVPVQVMFTDFQGKEIATNSGAKFSAEQTAWLRRMLEAGRPASAIFASSAGGGELVALEPMVYARTISPEGAVFYKVALDDINVGPAMALEWGTGPAPGAQAPALTTPVPVPGVFEHLHFRVRGADSSLAPASLSLPYLHVLLIMLALFAVVAFGGVRLARLLTTDLRRLENFSTRLIGSGLSTERAPEAGSAEVASLARAMNDMLERLNEQHEALLTEREKLTHLTEALQAADQKKDAFLAMLGHELRNPLAPISLGAELLKRVASTDPRVMRTSEVIARQVAHMTKIVSDLLDVSRVTRGLITLDKREVEISEVVSAGIEQVRPLLEAHRHTLETSMPPNRVMVSGDHARLVQVVSNLLTNAAKYTPDSGHVAVTVEASPSNVSISVKDNGIGIPPELMPELFDLFTQGTRTADRSQGGLGLGLALVKRLVKLHGGSVEASSPGTGQGALFTVHLPRAPDALLPESPRAPGAEKMPGGALRVLVVDDNIDAAHTLSQWLAIEGHEVQVAHEGRRALVLAEEASFDVFVLDIGLPGMDGMELARRLRKLPPCAQATFIALTGYGQDADREHTRAAGFDHHLVKPADPDAMRALLRVRVLESG